MRVWCWRGGNTSAIFLRRLAAPPRLLLSRVERGPGEDAIALADPLRAVQRDHEAEVTRPGFDLAALEHDVFHAGAAPAMQQLVDEPARRLPMQRERGVEERD